MAEIGGNGRGDIAPWIGGWRCSRCVNEEHVWNGRIDAQTVKREHGYANVANAWCAWEMYVSLEDKAVRGGNGAKNNVVLTAGKYIYVADDAIGISRPRKAAVGRRSCRITKSIP